MAAIDDDRRRGPSPGSRKTDCWKNTFVFYFGDHGGVLPRRKRLYLRVGASRAARSCAFRRDFQHLVDAEAGAAGSAASSASSTSGPPFFKLAGVDVPEQVDGRPFLGEGRVGEGDQRPGRVVWLRRPLRRKVRSGPLPPQGQVSVRSQLPAVSCPTACKTITATRCSRTKSGESCLRPAN